MKIDIEWLKEQINKAYWRDFADKFTILEILNKAEKSNAKADKVVQ